MRFRDLPAGFLPNTTHRCPDAARGKRVAVVLRNGHVQSEPVNKDTPPGWAADGKGGCRWTHHRDTSSPSAAFDIMGFKVL